MPPDCASTDKQSPSTVAETSGSALSQFDSIVIDNTMGGISSPRDCDVSSSETRSTFLDENGSPSPTPGRSLHKPLVLQRLLPLLGISERVRQLSEGVNARRAKRDMIHVKAWIE